MKPDSPFENLIGVHSEFLTEVVSHCISAFPFHYLFVANCFVYVLYGCLQVVQVGHEVKDFFNAALQQETLASPSCLEIWFVN